MTSRERFRAALEHRLPDRVPLDLGATCLTGMRPRAQERLAEALGFPGTKRPVNNGFDERIMEWAGTDFRSVGNLIQLPSTLARRISETAYVNYWGCRYDLIDGERQITHHPLAKVTTIEELKAFPWPEPVIPESDLRRFEAEARRLHGAGRYVVVGEHPICGKDALVCYDLRAT